MPKPLPRRTRPRGDAAPPNERWKEAHRAGYLHVGDVVWRVWDTLIAYDPRRVVDVWEGEAGDLIGFALLYPMYAGFNLQVHLEHRGGTL